MKIAMIHGQNHKGSSYHLGRLLAEKLAPESDITEFFLPKDLNHFCLGCYNCIKDEKKCPFYEEKHVITDAIEQADLLIFTTPTYCLRASAPMKSFLDFTFIRWMPHRPNTCMFHKKAVVFSTAAGSGTRTAIKDITTALHYCGVSYIKTYGVSVQAMCWEDVTAKKKEKINRYITKLSHTLLHSAAPRVSLKIKFIFYMMRIMQKAGWGSGPSDYNYWETNGWLGKTRPW